MQMADRDSDQQAESGRKEEREPLSSSSFTSMASSTSVQDYPQQRSLLNRDAKEPESKHRDWKPSIRIIREPRNDHPVLPPMRKAGSAPDPSAAGQTTNMVHRLDEWPSSIKCDVPKPSEGNEDIEMRRSKQKVEGPPEGVSAL